MAEVIPFAALRAVRESRERRELERRYAEVDREMKALMDRHYQAYRQLQQFKERREQA